MRITKGQYFALIQFKSICRKSNQMWLNSLPNFESELKAFADDKLNVAEMMISFSDRVENNVGKGENVGYQNVPLFPQCFSGPLFQRL